MPTDVNQHDSCFAPAVEWRTRPAMSRPRCSGARCFLSVRLTFELSQSRQLVRCQSFNRFSVISW
jgi:hypothetical protein